MTVHGPFSVALRSQARALRDTLTVIIEPDERHGLGKREHALHAALPFGPFPEDHRRRNLLAILLFVLDPDHGSKRQLRPSRHVPWNQKDRPVVPSSARFLRPRSCPQSRGSPAWWSGAS